jgi:hypothetical protein
VSRFVVRVGYDRVVPTVRDVEVEAGSAEEAAAAAVTQAQTDEHFWFGAVELDGEIRSTEVISVAADDT